MSHSVLYPVFPKGFPELDPERLHEIKTPYLKKKNNKKPTSVHSSPFEVLHSSIKILKTIERFRVKNLLFCLTECFRITHVI